MKIQEPEDKFLGIQVPVLVLSLLDQPLTCCQLYMWQTQAPTAGAGHRQRL